MTRILIIEDEPSMSSALALLARRLNCEPVCCFSGGQGLRKLRELEIGLVILDIGLPDESGIEVLEKIRKDSASIPVLIITAHGNLGNAVAAKQLGASSYLVKPFDLEELRALVEELLQAETTPLPVTAERPALMVGAAPAMQRCFVQIAHACTSDVPVLISGPTGGGKTLAAQVIHANSARRAKPFITLHCNAIPDPLVESELFGHEKHAFTGAANMKSGHIERAQGGTLFLDEIGDISPAVQAKLLRFVEERIFVRVGGREEHSVDLRIIAATNRDLREDVASGRFREDLLYRLRVLEIEIPALCDRVEDIPAICSLFLGSASKEHRLSPAALKLISKYPWPGNVRELRNALEHAMAVATSPVILPQHLPANIRSFFLRKPSDPVSTLMDAMSEWIELQLAAGSSYEEMHTQMEGFLLGQLLPRFENKPTLMARALEMNRATLRSKLRQMKLAENLSE